MRLAGVIFLCMLIFPSCSHDKRPIDISVCRLGNFTLALDEHIIEKIEKPIVVSSVKGKITNEVGGWPDNTRILFEIRRIGKAAKTIQAIADGDGNFEMPHVAKGYYCFKATVDGWRSVMGIIKVDRRADPTKAISIVMIPGV